MRVVLTWPWNQGSRSHPRAYLPRSTDTDIDIRHIYVW
jgi:hypothetical protein